MGRMTAILAILALIGAFIMAKKMGDRRATTDQVLDAEHAEVGAPPVPAAPASPPAPPPAAPQPE